MLKWSQISLDRNAWLWKRLHSLWTFSGNLKIICPHQREPMCHTVAAIIIFCLSRSLPLFCFGDSVSPCSSGSSDPMTSCCSSSPGSSLLEIVWVLLFYFLNICLYLMCEYVCALLFVYLVALQVRKGPWIQWNLTDRDRVPPLNAGNQTCVLCKWRWVPPWAVTLAPSCSLHPRTITCL